MEDRRELSVFTYHYVRDFRNTQYPAIKGVDVRDFRAQLEYLRQHYNVIAMEDLLAALDGDELPERAVLLTFDDGYRDHFEFVFPMLQEYGWQGSFFVPMQPVFEGRVLDVNKIHFVLATGDLRDVRSLLFRELGRWRDAYRLRSDDEYYRTYAKAGRFDGPDVKFVKNMLQFGLGEPVRKQVLDALFAELVGVPEDEFARQLYLSIGEIQEMGAAGMHIGNHGYGHHWLGKMSRAEQAEDLDKSWHCLAQLDVDPRCWTMCYPYGSYNAVTAGLLGERGCVAAFATVGGQTSVSEGERYGMVRFDVNDLENERREAKSTEEQIEAQKTAGWDAAAVR